MKETKMPRVNRVEHARKSPGNCGKCGCVIQAGAPYVWWKFRYGGKRVRCGQAACAPKPADLTQSEFLSTLYDIQETTFPADTIEDLESAKDEVVSRLEELRDQQEEKRSNMPDSLQESDTGNMLQERYDAIDSAISDIESVDITDLDPEDKDEGETDEDFATRQQEHRDEIAAELAGVLEGISV